jgi:hypothetical protein
MSIKSKPAIKPCKSSENWTCVTFKPDLSKFGMEELEHDTVALMRKRVYDLAGVLGKGVKVSQTGTALCNPRPGYGVLLLYLDRRRGGGGGGRFVPAGGAARRPAQSRSGRNLGMESSMGQLFKLGM